MEAWATALVRRVMYLNDLTYNRTCISHTHLESSFMYSGASPFTVVLSIIPALYFIVKPFTSIGTHPNSLEGSPHRQFSLVASLAVAILIILVRIWQVVSLAGTKNWLASKADNLFSLSGFTRLDCEREEAASYKVMRMLRNSHEFIRDKTPQENIVAAFHVNEEKTEQVGGHFWTWKRMKARSLYREEGIHFSARLLAANIMQFLIIRCTSSLLFLLYLVSNMPHSLRTKRHHLVCNGSNREAR